MATIRIVPELCVCINTKLLSNKNNKSEICGGLVRNSSCVGVLNVYGKRRCSRRWRVKAVARSDVNGNVRVIEKSSGGNVNGNRSGLVDIPIFGEVAEGLETLSRINEAYVDEKGRPYKNIRIKHTYILEDPFDDPPQLAELVPDASPEGKPKDEVYLYVWLSYRELASSQKDIFSLLIEEFLERFGWQKPMPKKVQNNARKSLLSQNVR